METFDCEEEPKEIHAVERRVIILEDELMVLLVSDRKPIRQKKIREEIEKLRNQLNHAREGEMI